MSIQKLPSRFVERLKKILMDCQIEGEVSDFFSSSKLTVRCNSLKISTDELKKRLDTCGIRYKEIDWCKTGFIIDVDDKASFLDMDFFKKGELYKQNASSQFVPFVVDPQPGEEILDMCAAPGGKTTQMAAMMANQGRIVAIECVKKRYYRLKSVIDLLGVENVQCVLKDARRFRAADRLFDRILVDAPCSSEGRFNLDDEKTYKYWSLRKVKEMVRKQRGLLFKSFELLKPGGTLVYSTCTFSPEENEGVVDWFLNKSGQKIEMQTIDIHDIMTCPVLKGWNKKVFSQQLQMCVRIRPSQYMDAFFIAKMKKVVS